MTPSLARRTLLTAVSLALCTGLLGLVLGFGAGVWWGRRERAWYVDVACPLPEGVGRVMRVMKERTLHGTP